jgi:epoxyqueuosine reductase
MSSVSLNSSAIKAQAQRLGFVACGLAKAEPVAENFARHYQHWLELDYCGEMDYMRRNVEMRLNPDLLVPGVKTIVSLAMNFMPLQHQPAISLYAQGLDYHDVMRKRMQELMKTLQLEGRCFVDTAPVLERYWAWRSGIGIITPEGGFISVPGYGPTVFLGELFLLDEADHYGSPLHTPHLGECLNLAEQENSDGNGALSPPRGGRSRTRALCPALTPDGLDARLCISYQTIEHRGPLPDEMELKRTFYGCDRCLRATPQFAEAKPTDEPAFQPSEALLHMMPEDWQDLTEEQYKALFKGSAIKRAKFDGLKRNIERWLKRPNSSK